MKEKKYIVHKANTIFAGTYNTGITMIIGELVCTATSCVSMTVHIELHDTPFLLLQAVMIQAVQYLHDFLFI